MRNGILLAEDSPTDILTRYNVESLEDAFLQLCMKQGVSEEADQSLRQVETKTDMPQITDGKEPIKRKNSIESNNTDTCCADLNCNKKSFVKSLKFTTKRRMKALLTKNFLQMFRQPA
jgi:hypothetical protein